MYLMVRITDSSVYIMDTEDGFCIDEMPKTVFIQSKCMGIPCETRYEEVLRDFSFSQLRAGFKEFGVEFVIQELCELLGKQYSGLVDSCVAMPLGSLANVVSNSVKEIRSSVESTKGITEDDLRDFNSKLESLRDGAEYYEAEEDFDDSIFGSEEEESEFLEEDSDFEDDDIYDYDDDDSSYEDDLDAEEDGSEDMFCVARLYGLLSKVQVDLLQKYYKWYSKRVFMNENGSLHLDTIKSIRYQEWKKKELAQIRGDEEWSYEGCIDTGSYPGAYCEMGHPLRYVHFAKGAESGKVVSFGNKCVSDFFEVDTTVMRAIRKAQVESTNDLVELFRIYSSESTLGSAKASFRVLDFVLDKLEEKGNVRLGIVKLALEFKKLDLVYPKTLVKELKKAILSLDSLRDLTVGGECRTKLLSLCFGDDGVQVDNYLTKGSYLWRAWNQSSLLYPSTSFEFQACSFFEWVFGIEFDGIHRYNPSLGLNVRDEGGKSKKAIKLYTNRESNAKKSIFYEEGVDVIETATRGISIIASMLNAHQLFSSFSDNWKLPYLNAYDSKYHNLKVVKECRLTSEELLKKLLVRYGFVSSSWMTTANRFMEIQHCLGNFKTGFTEICKSVVLDEQPLEVSGFEELKNLDYSTLSVDNSINKLQLYIDRVMESPLASFFEKKESFGLDVFSTIKGTRRVSSKQAWVLSRLADSLIETLGMLESGNYENAKIEGGLSKEDLATVERAIAILEDGKNFNVVVRVLPTSALMKIKDVLVSVSKRKAASEKQMYYVNLAKNLVSEVDKSTSN